MKNISGLYLAFLALFTNNAHARMCELDPNFPDQLCTKVSYVDSSVELIRSYKEGKWVYLNKYKDLKTGKEWPVLLFERRQIFDIYALLTLTEFECVYPKIGKVEIVQEESCIKWNNEREASRKADEEKELEKKRIEQNPELKSVIYVYFSTRIEKNGVISLILRNKENLEKYGLDFPSNNFTLIGSSRNYLSRSYISSGENESKAYKLVSIDKNGQVIEVLAFNADLETTKNKKPIQAKYVRAYFSKVKPVRKVQLFHKGVLITEKDFDYTRERMD